MTENHRILIAVFCSSGILLWFCLGLAAMMLRSRKLWQAARICLLCAAILSDVDLIAPGIYLIWWNIKSIWGRKS